jgi:hypothetical protein
LPFQQAHNRQTPKKTWKSPAQPRAGLAESLAAGHPYRPRFGFFFGLGDESHR